MATTGQLDIEFDNDDGIYIVDGCGANMGVNIVLEIIFEDKGATQVGWHRYRNVQVPNGANIVAAYFHQKYLQDNKPDAEATIYGDDADDSAEYTTDLSTNPVLRTATSADVDGPEFPPPSNPPQTAPPFTAVDWQRSYTITSIVQEIVNRPGWSPGNAMSFIQRDFGGCCGELLVPYFRSDTFDAPPWLPNGETGGARIEIFWENTDHPGELHKILNGGLL